MIRQLTPADATAWRAFRIEMLTEAPYGFATTLAEAQAFDLSHYEKMLSDCSVLVYEDDGIQGSAGWHAMSLPTEAHRAYLFAVYVRPEARGRGLAQRLINMACDQARAAGHVQIELNSNAGNTPAVELYKRCGFEVFGHLPRALIIDGVTGDDFLMWRRLDT